MATTPIASLVACSWCGLLAERGPICDSCGSPVAETTGRTSVLRVPEARDVLREGLRSSRQRPAPAPTQPAAPTPVHPQPSPTQDRAPTIPAAPPRRPAARWLSLNQAAVMSGLPERTLRGWASSRTPEDVPVREGDPRFLLIRTPGVKLPDGLWMLDEQTSTLIPVAAPAVVSTAPTTAPSPAVPVVLPVPRPDLPAPVAPATPVTPVAPGPNPPPPSRPQPPMRAPIVAAPAQPVAPVEENPVPAAKPMAPAERRAQPARRGPALSDSYVAALLAEEGLPETWGFDSSPDERKMFRRHKFLTTGGIVLGFAGVAELIDFLMGHLLH